MTEKIIPDGYKLVAVKGLDELVYWLERCKDKGHLENCADLIEPFEAFEYRNVSEEAVIAAHEAKAAPAVPQGVMEALRDALSVCSSVSVSRDRKIVRDGCTLYAQTEEWCNWAENEVAPKIRAAIELVATTAAPSQPSKYGSPELQALIVAHATQSQPVTLTDDGARRVALSIIEDLEGRKGVLDDVDDDVKQEMLDSFAETIIAALREKEQAK